MARVANTSLFKRIRVFSNFCVFFQLAENGKWIGEFHWSWILGDRTQVWTGDEKNHHRVFIFTPSKQRPVKKFQVLVVHGKEIYQAACYTCKICCLTFKTFCFLTWLFSLLSPSSLLKPLSFIDRMCVNCWESECVFLYEDSMNAYEMIGIPSTK